MRIWLCSRWVASARNFCLVGIFAGSAVLMSSSAETYAAMPGRPDGAEVKLVTDCLADAVKNNTAQDVCIGRVIAQCIKTTSAYQEKKACSDREFLVWSESLNHDFSELTKRLQEGDLRQALNEVQRNFYAEKASKCAFERNARANSPEALFAASVCDVQSTARQDLWLRAQIGALGNP